MAVPLTLVVIPYYRGTDHLRAAIGSVTAQTSADWRAVVLDDSELGEAEAVVSGVADQRVSYERPIEHRGIAGSFNRAFEIAERTEAHNVVILHADDMLDHRYVASVAQAHRMTPRAAAVIPKSRVVDSDGSPSTTLTDLMKRFMWPNDRSAMLGERGLVRLLTGQFFYCPSVSYSVPQIAGMRWSTEWKQVMDVDLYGRMLISGRQFILLDESLFVYRRHALSATASASQGLLRAQEEAEVSEALSAAAQAKGWSRAAMAGHLRLTVRANTLIHAGRLVAARNFRLAAQAVALALQWHAPSRHRG